MEKNKSQLLRSPVYIMALCISLLLQNATACENKYIARVKKVIDGDSLIVMQNNNKKEIRLWGVDSPEWGQPYSKRAKKFLKDTVMNNTISVQPYYHDDYGRLVAGIFYNQVNINQLMVEKGYAWVHIYYCNKEICKEWSALQREAKKKKLGLWREADPVPPWEWKRMKRK